MLCSLLRVIQLYVASTALFSTSSTIYTDKAYKPVALMTSMVHPPTHIHNTITVLYQPAYRKCFLQTEIKPSQLLFDVADGLDLKKWRIENNVTKVHPPVKRPLLRRIPTKKPTAQSAIHPSATTGGKPKKYGRSKKGGSSVSGHGKNPRVVKYVPIYARNIKHIPQVAVHHGTVVDHSVKPKPAVHHGKVIEHVVKTDHHHSLRHDGAHVQHGVKLVHHDAKPVHHNVKPVHHDNKPVHHDVKPVHHDNKPAHTGVKPVHRDNKPLHHDVKPVHHDNKPVHHEVKPVHRDNKPAHTGVKPVHRDNKPVHHEVKPVHHDNKPVHTGVKPVHHDNKPAHHDVKPVHHDVKPVHHEGSLGPTIAVRSHPLNHAEPHVTPVQSTSNAHYNAPTQAPTKAPIQAPTQAPTKAPTKPPTQAPTHAPTKPPTQVPTKPPTKAPTTPPTNAPTRAPLPTHAPLAETATPTHAPIQSPTPKMITDSTFVSCVKSPQHLHGLVWEGSKHMEIAYTATEYMLDQCAAACKQDGFTYYAMDSGVNCWCAINAPDASHVDNTMCSACADDASRTCGNVHYGFMSVYHIAPSKFVLPSLDGVHTLGARSVSTVLSTDAHHVDKHRVTGEPLKKKISHKAHSDDDDDDDDDDEHRHRHSHLNRLRRMRRLRRLMRMRRAKHEHDDDDEHEHRHHEKEDD